MSENMKISIQKQCLDAFSYELTRIALSPIQNDKLSMHLCVLDTAMFYTPFRRFL